MAAEAFSDDRPKSPNPDSARATMLLRMFISVLLRKVGLNARIAAMFPQVHPGGERTSQKWPAAGQQSPARLRAQSPPACEGASRQLRVLIRRPDRDLPIRPEGASM